MRKCLGRIVSEHPSCKGSDGKKYEIQPFCEHLSTKRTEGYPQDLGSLFAGKSVLLFTGVTSHKQLLADIGCTRLEL